MLIFGRKKRKVNDLMENDEKAQKSAATSSPEHVLMINAATLRLEPGKTLLIVQEQVTDSSDNSTNTLPLRIIYKPLSAKSKSNTTMLLVEPEDPEFEDYLAQSVTNDGALAELCRKALEKSYGSTVPIPTGFVKRQLVMNRC
jgi:Ni,Fe-hydrogenase maturation factor